jgi:hypothetical protein
MSMIKRSWEEELDHKFDRALEALKKDRDRYDEQTKIQLDLIKNSDRDIKWYLKEILWELTYMRRRTERP